jgi:hypothetical protein
MKPVSLAQICSQTAQPPLPPENPYIKAVLEQLQSSTRSSDHATIFLLGQAFGFLAGEGQEVQISPQTAQLIVSEPEKAASSLAPKIASRCCRPSRGHGCREQW